MCGFANRIAELNGLRREGAIRSILVAATAAAAARNVLVRHLCFGHRTCIGNWRLGVGRVKDCARLLKGPRLFAISVWTAGLILVARFKIALLV